MTAPTMLDAMESTIRRALEKSDDKLVRAEDFVGLPCAEIIARLDPKEVMRFGFTLSCAKQKIRRKGVSADPREMMQWRNEPVSRRRAHPTIFLGSATGRNEAGLRRVPSIIREADILREFLALADAYLRKLTESTKPRTFLQ